MKKFLKDKNINFKDIKKVFTKIHISENDKNINIHNLVSNNLNTIKKYHVDEFIKNLNLIKKYDEKKIILLSNSNFKLIKKIFFNLNLNLFEYMVKFYLNNNINRFSIN